MLFAKQNLVESSHVKVANTFQVVVLGFRANKLSLNIAKTFFVIFHPHRKRINNSLNIEIDGKPINQQKSVKCLGILIHCHLNWKEQIQQISKKNI